MDAGEEVGEGVIYGEFPDGRQDPSELGRTRRYFRPRDVSHWNEIFVTRKEKKRREKKIKEKKGGWALKRLG